MRVPLVNTLAATYQFDCQTCTAPATKASYWDIEHPDSIECDLDDSQLQPKLAALRSMWDTTTHPDTNGSRQQFALITATGVPSDDADPLQVRRDTLRALIDAVGFAPQPIEQLLTSWLPTQLYRLQYDGDADVPTSLTLAFRCPKNSNGVLGFMRIHFATRTCVAFLAGRHQSDMDDIRSRCMREADLLRIHPVYLLSFVYENRYRRWGTWYAELWREIALVETRTGMTHDKWKLPDPNTEQLQPLASASGLLKHLHATNTEFCHTGTVMEAARKFGGFCGEMLAKVESRRGDLGAPPMRMRDRVAFEESLRSTTVRFEFVADRLSELQARLAGQITVSYNLIAQKNNEINLTIAKLQTHDSRMVKGIAILTLLFLPSTLIATLWSTSLIQIEGTENWHIFLEVCSVLTVVVFLCWWLYVRVTRVREEKRWPVKDNLELSLA